MENLKYLVCLDVEATCWESDQRAMMGHPLRDKMEIIEIAIVLVNTSTESIESEFHSYVRPVKHPILSGFCRRFTGIDQSVIDRQSPFPVVYQSYREWMDKAISENDLMFGPRNRNAAFCSWTSYDFKDFLKRDFQYHNIPMPNEMKTWIDMKLLFKDRYWIRHMSFKLRDALRTAGSHWTGPEHSGLSDARNLARLALRMIQSGHAISGANDSLK